MGSTFLCVDLFHKPQYESTATLYLGSRGTDEDYATALKLISDCSYVMKSQSVLEQTALNLHLDLPADGLEKQITIKNPEGTRILEVMVTADSPQLAKDIVDMLCTLGKEKIASTIGFYQISVHEFGSLDAEPCNQPGLVLYLLIAIITASLLYALFLLLYILDPHLRSGEEAAEKLDLPLLAKLPADGDPEKDPAVRDVYHHLHSYFRYHCEERQIVALSCCGTKKHRSAIAMNLAETLSSTGSRVLLIDCDFRTLPPERQERYIKPKGLSEVLQGHCFVDDVLNPRKNGNVQFILSGETPTDPAGLLGSPAFSALLKEMRRQYDFILLDTAPLDDSVDAFITAAECDGLLLCLDEQPLPNVRSALSRLQPYQSELLGFLWTK